MRTLSAENAAALAARELVARDFLWMVVRERDTGDSFAYGFWSDVGDVSAQVVNPDTGLPSTRSFEGAGTLIQISDIPLVSNLTVQNVTVKLSQFHETVAEFVRGYNLKQARVEVYRGLFSPASRALVAPAPCRFVGFVDEVTIDTPSENEDGGISLNCVSSTQEFTRSNPDTRSNDSQKNRLSTDTFFQDATVVGEWEFFWGQKRGKVQSSKPQRKAISLDAVQ